MTIRIHPTAILEDDVTLGEGTCVWDHVHIRRGTSLGEECLVGGKTLIAYDVEFGSRVKINSAAYICNGVTLVDGVMISACVIFTNYCFSRAETTDLSVMRTSMSYVYTLPPLVRDGAT